MALYTLQKVRRDLEQEKSTGNRVRIVSLSFDPAHDTPGVMRAYGAGETQRRSPVSWDFLTARSPQDLRPVLDGLGQDVRVPVVQTEAENPANLTHMLKVFLIDRNGWVREIYTSSFLVSQVIVNDVQTLLLRCYDAGCLDPANAGSARSAALQVHGAARDAGAAHPKHCALPAGLRYQRKQVEILVAQRQAVSRGSTARRWTR